MKNQLYSFIGKFISYSLIFLLSVIPLVAFNFTTDFFDIPKLILLIPFAIILTGLWVFSWVLKGKIDFVRTQLDLPLIFLIISLLLSTFFSTSKYTSIYGAMPEVHGSVVSWITYVVLYFLITSHLKKSRHVKLLLQGLIVSASVISLISILSYFQIYLPFEMARGLNFTPAGSTFSANAFLLILLPLSLFSILEITNVIPQAIAIAVAVLFTITIALTGSLSVFVILTVIFVLVTIIGRRHLSGKNLAFILSPFSLFVFLMILVNLPFNGNKLHEVRKNFPQEIQLPASVSWKIAATAFRDAPLVGTGPSTFIYNFTSYKPSEFNLLSFWNYSFNSAYNEFLQVLGTWGILGFIADLLICGVVLKTTRNHIFGQKQVGLYKEESPQLLPSLALGAIVSIMLFVVHTTTLVSVVISMSFYAALMISQRKAQDKTNEISLGLKIATLNNKQVDFLPVVTLILYLIASVFISGKFIKAVSADYYHRLALAQAGNDGTKTYEYLQKAEALNPYVDLYRVDMAQTNFALANTLASQKGPTEDNPQGTLTNDDKNTIQTLVTQAINEGRASVVLAPRSSRNWEVLAIIYRNITGVAKNSLTFALDAYGRAIQLDPLNPSLRVNAGSIYYGTQNYDLAIRFFTDAVNLKPDYVNGYYNLALAMKDSGDLQNAKIVAEQAVGLLQREFGTTDYINSTEQLKQIKINDFNTVTNLLSDINLQIDEGVQESEIQSSTGQNGALQNPDLPNIEVPDLNNPPETAPPPAVQENPEVQLPELTPTSTTTPTP